MSIFEYNEEQHLKLEKEESREEGRIEGEARLAKLLQALAEGDACLAKLLQALVAEERDEDVRRAISDRAYREQLYREKQI